MSVAPDSPGGPPGVRWRALRPRAALVRLLAS